MQVPKSIVIIGGGYIAVEFAGIFAGLGAEVHLVYRQDMPLRGFDEEVRCACCAALCMLCCAAHAVLRRAGLALRCLCRPTMPHRVCAAGALPVCTLTACLQVRKFATEQYALNGLHLHPLSTPDQLTKLPDGRLLFKGARRAGEVSASPCRQPPAASCQLQPMPVCGAARGSGLPASAAAAAAGDAR